MKRTVLLLGLGLILAAPAGPALGANNFSGDANCVALWSFENGALTTDSVGTNTLTSSGTPVADAVNFMELAGSVDFERDDTADFYSILDGSLDAGFPFKNGDATKNLSICCWVRIEDTIGTATAIITKLNSTTASIRKYSFWLGSGEATANRFSMGFGNATGEAWDQCSLMTADAVTGRWYHIGITYEDATLTLTWRVWDNTASAFVTGGTSTDLLAASPYVGTGGISIGKLNNVASRWMDGNVDELVVFNDVLTAAEIDEIRGGTYGGGASRVFDSTVFESKIFGD